MDHEGGAAATAAKARVARAAGEREATRASGYLGVGGIVLALAIACALPFTMSGFRLFQFTQVFTYAIALLGLNILTGYNGQISIGHGAFYAVGAYTTAIMIDKWNVPYGWTIPVAGLVGPALRFPLRVPGLPPEGVYPALPTL